jgi:hypothetical protein
MVAVPGVETTLSAETAGAAPIRPLLGPVSAPKINGTIDAFGAVIVPDPAPTLAWSPPAVGTAAKYQVMVRELSNVNGRTVSDVATLTVGSATSVKFCPESCNAATTTWPGSKPPPRPWCRAADRTCSRE